jgi:hypothetical protein
MSFSAPSTCGCPITRTLTVTFTGSNPAPSNGYIVKWSIPNGAWNYVTPNPTSSPVSIPNVPACEDVTVVMQSQCDNSQVSAEQTIVATGSTLYDCGDTITASHTHNGFYIYPEYILDVRGAAGTVTINYDVIDKPNRITVYDDLNNSVATSDWQGVAAYPGQWGASLNTPTTGFFSFTKGEGKCFYKIVIESITDTSYQDSCTLSISCPITAPVTPTIQYLECLNGYGSYKISAPAGTTMKLSLSVAGSLVNNSVSGWCARIFAGIASSTGPSATLVSNTIQTGGTATVGANNSLFVNVTVPGSGYLVINTQANTINSSAEMTNGALRIFELNGAALASSVDYTIGVCIGEASGVVNCT